MSQMSSQEITELKSDHKRQRHQSRKIALGLALTLVLQFLSVNASYARYSANDQAEALFNKGCLLMKDSKYSEAVQWYRKATALDVTFVAANINMTLSFNQLNDYGSAITAASQALRYNQTSSYALYHRGCAYMQLGNFASAAQDFTRAIATEPNNPGYYLQRARCFESMGQKQKAGSPCGRH